MLTFSQKNHVIRLNYSGQTYFCIGLKYPMVAFPLKFFWRLFPFFFVKSISDTFSTTLFSFSIFGVLISRSEYSSSGCISCCCPFKEVCSMAFLSDSQGLGRDVWNRVLNRFPASASSPAKFLSAMEWFDLYLIDSFVIKFVSIIMIRNCILLFIYQYCCLASFLHFYDTFAMNARIVQTMQHKFFFILQLPEQYPWILRLPEMLNKTWHWQ